MKKIGQLFSPNFLDKISFKTMLIITAIQIFIILTAAQFNSNELIPKPSGILHAISNIVSEKTFLDDFFATLGLILKGMGLAIFISLFFSYLSLVPVFSGITQLVSKLRFLTYTGLLFVFTIVLRDGHEIKISLLLFGIIPYFVTSFLAYVNDISRKEYELCYSLKFSRWRTLYEVIIRGKFHFVLEVIKQNFAIAWMMITFVEGLCMSEGGLGTMMIKSNKYMKIDQVFAVLTIIFLVGILFDYLFSVLKVWAFPYTDTKRYNKLWINLILNGKK